MKKSKVIHLQLPKNIKYLINKHLNFWILYKKSHPKKITKKIKIFQNRSESSLKSVKSETQNKEELFLPPLDVFTIKVQELHVPDENPKPYFLKISFFDQLLLSSVVTSSTGRGVEVENKKSIAKGCMNYDPSDYEKMCLFANSPLTGKNEETFSKCTYSSLSTISQHTRLSCLIGTTTNLKIIKNI